MKNGDSTECHLINVGPHRGEAATACGLPQATEQWSENKRWRDEGGGFDRGQQMIRLPRCCWRARSVPLRGSYFNDIIHPQQKRRTAKSKRDWAMGRRTEIKSSSYRQRQCLSPRYQTESEQGRQPTGTHGLKQHFVQAAPHFNSYQTVNDKVNVKWHSQPILLPYLDIFRDENVEWGLILSTELII